MKQLKIFKSVFIVLVLAFFVFVFYPGNAFSNNFNPGQECSGGKVCNFGKCECQSGTTWNGSQCVANTTHNCAQWTHWNGTACVPCGETTQKVPEPLTLTLLLAGMIGLAGFYRKNNKQ